MLLKLFNLCLATGLLLLTLLWLSSYTHYTSIGVDSERVKGETVDYHYYRLWWPGNGSLLVGRGITMQPFNPEKQYDNFDLGAAFFRPQSRKLEARTAWNKTGFWYINPPKPVRQYWLGIPAWLPVALILGYFIIVRRCRKRTAG